jgi:uncharacterized glyoxalase superfamily protein PhnB
MTVQEAVAFYKYAFAANLIHQVRGAGKMLEVVSELVIARAVVSGGDLARPGPPGI